MGLLIGVKVSIWGYRVKILKKKLFCVIGLGLRLGLFVG